MKTGFYICGSSLKIDVLFVTKTESVFDAYRSYRLSSFIRAHLHSKKANAKANIFLLDVNQVFECRENP